MADQTVHKIGNVDSPNSSVTRIVHISDTHMRHDSYKSSLPEGDILIHSGDFSQWHPKNTFQSKSRLRTELIDELNTFFQSVSFKHKIFVPGNHESKITPHDQEYMENNLTAVTYLQDKMVTVDGINIYGSPWTANRWYSYADAFTKPWGKIERFWDAIPEQTDILVTHLPPQGILDKATMKFSWMRNLFKASERTCNACGKQHEQFEHWGCRHLQDVVLKKVRPVVHMFGHVHEENGVTTQDGITFSNAAMKLRPRINVFDLHK